MMHSAILIVDISTNLNEIKSLSRPVIDLDLIDNEELSLYAKNLEIVFRISAGDKVQEWFYDREHLKMINNRINNPYSYLVEFIDFEIFKQVMSAIWENMQIVIDNDYGYLITVPELLAKLKTYQEFVNLRDNNR